MAAERLWALMKKKALSKKWNSYVKLPAGRIAGILAVAGMIAFAASAAIFGNKDGIPDDINVRKDTVRNGSFISVSASETERYSNPTYGNSVMMWKSYEPAVQAPAAETEDEVSAAAAEAAVSAAEQELLNNISFVRGAVVTASWMPENKDVISYTKQEFDMMCSVVMAEVGYMDDELKLAIANVIIDRVKSEKFPETVYEVLHQENQFTAIDNYYNRRLEPDEDVIRCVKDALSGKGAELVKGATFYYTPGVSSPAAAQWFENLCYCATVGNGRFFRAWDDV